MQHHTFLCGSAKSKRHDAYYIHHNDRFWGRLRDVGITGSQIKPVEYRRLGQDYGIYLTEIVDPAEYRVPQDSDIEPHQVQSGIENLDERIDEYDPNRIAFVGKNAATWFYRYVSEKEITHSQQSGHKMDRRNLEGLELEWDYKGLDYFLLSNTHRHWDRDIWMGFWELCKEDVRDFRSGIIR